MEMGKAEGVQERDVQARYLLGQLSEEEAAALEERYFGDDDLYKAIQSSETDLLDEYARGELSRRDRQAFERLLASSPVLRSRLAAAVAIGQGLNFSAMPASRSSRWGTLLAAAAAILLATAGSWLAFQSIELRRNLTGLQTQVGQLEGQNAQLRQKVSDLTAAAAQRPAPQAPTGATLLLGRAVGIAVRPGLTRGIQERNDFSIPRGASAVLIEVPAAAEGTASYRIRIEKPEGPLILEQQGLPAVRGKQGAVVVVATTPQSLPGGDYILRLSRRKSGSGFADAGDFAFRILYR
jgi:hypothetical protein